MFVGHYAVAFALKGKVKDSSLGMLFIATQFVDILFFPFVLLGIEKMRLVEGFTAVNNFDMYFYPFTHGLLGSVVWAVIFYAVYYIVVAKGKANRKAIAWIMALGVLSHWFADLIVHTPDLPLVSGEPKLGFGLWESKELTYGVEAVLLIAGLIYYLKNTIAVSKIGNFAATGFVVFMLLVNYLNLYVLPKNDDINALTTSALASYFILAGVAYWADKKRV
ncbi:MAG: hypothetical protein ACI9V1_003245 [Spirosomataceae bacterium]|jgi:hypothetical protein